MVVWMENWSVVHWDEQMVESKAVQTVDEWAAQLAAPLASSKVVSWAHLKADQRAEWWDATKAEPLVVSTAG